MFNEKMKKCKNRGSALFLVIIFGVILSLTGTAFIYMAGEERIFSRAQIYRAKALYLADAGIERTKSLISIGAVNIFSRTTAFEPFGEVTLDTDPLFAPGTYKVKIIPEGVVSGDEKWERTFLVVSTGTSGNISKTVMLRAKFVNFAHYAYFSDKELDVPDGAASVPREEWDERIWFYTGDKFDGPVHSNDEISLCGSPGFDFIDGKYQVTTAKDFYYFNCKSNRGSGGSGVPLNLPRPRDPGGPPYYPAVEPINMYENWNLTRLKDAAQAHGKYIPGNATIELKKNKLTYNGLNWDISTSSAVVFVAGDITSLYTKETPAGAHGLKSWLTIASSGTITIMGDITYRGGTEYPEGMLGLVAGKDIIVSADIPEENYEIEIHAVLMTYKSFWVEDWETRFEPSSDPGDPKPPAGTLNIFGGVIQRIREPVGRGYASAYVTDMKSGYAKSPYEYDNRVLDNPPPYFPQTIIFEPVSWEEKPVKKL